MSDISERVCFICEKVLSTKHNLITHERIRHKMAVTKDRTYRCFETGCEKTSAFSSRAAIQKHIAEFHTVTKTSSGPSICNVCSKTYTSKYSLYRHLRLVHKIQKQAGTLKCPVDNCQRILTNLAGIRIHLEKAHRVPNVNQKVEKKFPSKEDFMAWKTEEEKDKQSSFTARRSLTQVRDMKRRSYYCHRSGKYESGGTGQRRLKLQGSCKTGKNCPAEMKAEFYEDGSVKVEYWSTHFGHSISLAHMHLTDTQRAEIAEKLRQGVSFVNILDDIRNNTEGPLQRIHFLKRVDLYNIMTSFNLHSEKSLESDIASVASWVEALKELDESPVIFYKTQGVEGEDHVTLSEEDFMLVVMTMAQQEMMVRLGSDKICVDSIHDANGSDFPLTSVLIIDESGAAFPVAFCISNKISAAHMEQFFAAVREKVGFITASVFMSDDDPVYYNAWKAIMGNAKTRLLCTWNVDKIWRQQIQEKVTGDKDDKACVYKKLRALLEAKNEEDLENRVQECIILLSSDDATEAFGAYFQNAYASRVETWAFCFRAKAGIRKNVHLESMHKELKRVYLEDYKVKRLDKRLSELVKLSRDKTFQRMISLCETSKTLTVWEINERHKKSLDVSLSDVVPVEDGWHVTSQTNSNESHHVQRVEGNCHATCEMTCNDCYVCIHMYMCTCVDAMVHCTVCVHVHAVIRKIREQDESQGMVAYTVEVGTYDDLDTLIRACNEAQEPENPKQLLKRTFSDWLEFLDSDHPVEDTKLLQVDTFLKKMLAEVQCEQSDLPAEVHKRPLNKKIKLQDYRRAKTKEKKANVHSTQK